MDCGRRRSAARSAAARAGVLENVGHAQWVFTVTEDARVLRRVRYLSTVTNCIRFVDNRLERERSDVRIEHSHETGPRGVAAGPLALIGGLSELLPVLNGDQPAHLDVGATIKARRESGAAAPTGLFLREVQSDLGLIGTDAANAVTRYSDEPTLTYRASMGAYVFHRRLLRHVPPGLRLAPPDLARRLIAVGERVSACDHIGYWLDIGNPSHWERAQRDFEATHPALLCSTEA